MKKHSLAGTDLSISTFCYGTMQLANMADCDRTDCLINTYLESGGNFFDTAHCYCSWLPCGDGASERVLGEFLHRSGKRNDVVIATKGAHPAMDNYRSVERYMSAGRIGADIDDSLSRLRVDAIDLYWLHRDDPRVAVGEILDILNAEVSRGRIRYFGGSNWTAGRLQEANTYAREHGIAGFVASQPRWNLACDAEEPAGEARLQPGVLLALSESEAAWHAESKLPVIPYGPTANGFFATLGEKPDKYRTPRGLARLEAVKSVAAETGATPNQVALAWLLNQPFPVFPILGTGDSEHLRDALQADTVTLSQEQMTRLSCQ